ncbi:MAG: ribonuclease T2 family protein [Xanthobacteraceae bacterium]
MVRLGVRVFAVTVVLASFAASAQDRRQNRPGQFDFFVLALSWSPSFCEASAERGRAPKEQCGARPFSFVVHGLWPQYEKGFPEFCQNPSPRLDRRIVGSMLDLMPAPRLIFHQWDKHGTCSGLTQHAYFAAIRKARAQVKIPEDYLELTRILTVTPNAVEERFIKANPGMTRAGVAVTCNSHRLSEVRICLSKDFQFRDCAEIDRRACRRSQLVMPPVRGGPAAGK